MVDKARRTRKREITQTDWTRAVDELVNRTCDAGETTYEIAARVGLCVTTVRSRLKVAKQQGRLIVGRRADVTLDNKRSVVPVYRIIPVSQGKK